MYAYTGMSEHTYAFTLQHRMRDRVAMFVAVCVAVCAAAQDATLVAGTPLEEEDR